MTYAASGGPSGWAWLAMALSVLLLAALSVGAYLLLVRGSGGNSARHTTAERRLADQLARGQITQQEYLHLEAELHAARARRQRHVRGPTRRVTQGLHRTVGQGNRDGHDRSAT